MDKEKKEFEEVRSSTIFQETRAELPAEIQKLIDEAILEHTENKNEVKSKYADEKQKKRIKTLDEWFDLGIGIFPYKTPEKLEFNDVLTKVKVNIREMYELGVLSINYYKKDEASANIDITNKLSKPMNEITDNDMHNIIKMIVLGASVTQEYFLLLYYTAHCFKDKNFGTITFAQYIKNKENKNYSINGIKTKKTSKYQDYDKVNYKNTYDRLEKKLKNIKDRIPVNNDLLEVPRYSKINQLINEGKFTKNEIDSYIKRTASRELSNKIDEKLINYNSVYLPKAGLEDLEFIFEELSKNIAFKRFQSGKLNMIKEKDLIELKEKTIHFFVKVKNNSYKEAKIKVNHIFDLPDERQEEKEYIINIEKILKEAIDNFNVLLVDITYKHDLNNTREEFKENEKRIIEKYLLEQEVVVND